MGISDYLKSIGSLAMKTANPVASAALDTLKGVKSAASLLMKPTTNTSSQSELFSTSRPQNISSSGYTTNTPLITNQQNKELFVKSPSVATKSTGFEVPDTAWDKVSKIAVKSPQTTTGSSMPPAPASSTKPVDMSGFTSSDPDILKKIAEMNATANAQAAGNSSGITSGNTAQAGNSTDSQTTSPLQSFADQYLASLKATNAPYAQDEELNRIQQQMNDVNLSKQLGIEKTTEQPMEMGFITGQNAAIERRAANQLAGLSNQAQPLLTRLATEQAARQANLQSSQAAYGVAKDLYQNEKPMSVSAGSTLIDPSTGKVIYEAPEKESSYTPTASIQEYQYAVANGYKGSFTDYQNEDANRKATATGTGMLTPAQTQSAVTSIVNQFDNEPIVKNYNTTAEGYAFASQLANKPTKTSADDIGLIYAFAKAMDPNSVVREGEYATVQKYAQSWAETFGFNAKRIFSNTKFLSEEAVNNMIATIASKYNASSQAYKNVETEYNRRIQDAKSGQVSGSLTNYGNAWNFGGGTQSVNTGDEWDF